MRVTDLPLDTWVVIEKLPGGECNLLSRHATQTQAEAERDSRNKGLTAQRQRAQGPGAGGRCAGLRRRADAQVLLSAGGQAHDYAVRTDAPATERRPAGALRQACDAPTLDRSCSLRFRRNGRRQ